MPAKSFALPLFIQRQAMQLVMFGAVTFHRSALPGVSIDRVMELFVKWWGDPAVNTNTLRSTYMTMQREFIDLQRSQPEEKGYRVQIEVLGRDMNLLITAHGQIEARETVMDLFQYHDVKITRVEEEGLVTQRA